MAAVSAFGQTEELDVFYVPEPIVRVLSGEAFTLDYGPAEDGCQYAWFRNGRMIAEATTPAYTIPKVTVADAAAYECRVASPRGIFSVTKVLLVEQKLQAGIICPVSTMNVDAAVVIAVSACGVGPLSYQWQVNLDDHWVNLPSANQPLFVITHALAENSGQYRCAISDSRPGADGPQRIITEPVDIVVR